MILSKERLLIEAKNTGFRSEILEKVVFLMRLLEDFNKDAYLKERLVLKGGTALNLFYFDLPRLSIDIDLNYIGALDREEMLNERPKIIARIERICQGLGLNLYRNPKVHAGGKMIWRYSSALGHQGNIEIDLNFMYRIPLVKISKKSSVSIAGKELHGIPVLDLHELAAGKLSALIGRSAARDVFDARLLFQRLDLDNKKLKTLFVIYAGMNRKIDIRKGEFCRLSHDQKEFQHRLIPMLKRESVSEVGNIKAWSEHLMNECQKSLSRFFPLEENEHEFLTRLLDYGEISPALICDDELAGNVAMHPALQWTAFNAKRNKKI